MERSLVNLFQLFAFKIVNTTPIVKEEDFLFICYARMLTYWPIIWWPINNQERESYISMELSFLDFVVKQFSHEEQKGEVGTQIIYMTSNTIKIDK